MIKEYSYRKVNLYSVELKDIDLRLFLCEATLLFFSQTLPFLLLLQSFNVSVGGPLRDNIIHWEKERKKKKDEACGTSPEFCGTFFFSSFLFEKKLNCVFLAINKHTGTEGNNIRRENTTTAFFLSLFCFKSEFISDREQL